MLENGFNGFPRASRSIRARGPIGKKFDNEQKHSFEILASVAGKLLDKTEKCQDIDTSFARDQCCTCDGNTCTKKVDEELIELRSCDRIHENSHSRFCFYPGISGTTDCSDESLETTDEKHAFEDYPSFSGVIEEKVQGVPDRKLEEVNRNRRIKEELDIVASVDQITSENKPPNSGSNTQVVSEYGDRISFGAPWGDRDRRTNKISEFSYQKVVSNVKDESHYSTGGKIEEIYDHNRTCYTYEKSQKIFPFKKRKFFHYDPLPLSDQGFRQKDAFSAPENGINKKACSEDQQLSLNPKELKLSIKSSKVPEFFIDISAKAAVGSLKFYVEDGYERREIGEGLHVGILVQGKKVRIDNRTVMQTGNSQDEKCRSLGFVLEPKHSRTNISASFKDEPSLSRTRSHAFTRHCVPLASQQGTSKASLHPQSKKDRCAGTDLGDTSSTKTNTDSKSLVPVPKVSMKALAAVPFQQKSRLHEYGHRRIRRPFSVTEVEALVRAVEKLGTGRWRDVKFHSFDSAKHRTYVDLKDKWKTLVHTARISPQQRRGEPVPQELLDRVLAAQAYWSHRQAKQHAIITI